MRTGFWCVCRPMGGQPDLNAWIQWNPLFRPLDERAMLDLSDRIIDPYLCIIKKGIIKNCFFYASYYRIKPRRGDNAHRFLVRASPDGYQPNLD
jgi:hypothetical protein